MLLQFLHLNYLRLHKTFHFMCHMFDGHVWLVATIYHIEQCNR
jgi:hypothetical protein